MRSRFLILITVLSTLFLYTSFKLMRVVPGGGAAQAGALTALIFALMISWQVALRMRPEAFDTPWFHALSWMGSTVMGLWATFIMFSIPIDIIQMALAPFFDLSFSTGTTLAASGAGIVTALGFATVARGPHVKKVAIEFPRGASRLPEFLRIAQISDLHVGSTIRKAYVEDVVRRTNETRPDLIVLTGDFADGDAESVFPSMRPLGDLRARLGVFYVTGNHEYYWGADQLIAKIASLGIQALVNRHRIIDDDGAKIMVAGVTDPAGAHFIPGHTPDLKQALSADENCDFKILLAHRPGVCDEAEKLGADLQLSGHTHAGQFFPFSLLIPLAHKYYRGLNHHGRLKLYINPGTGYWGPPNRFTVASEITLLECRFK